MRLSRLAPRLLSLAAAVLVAAPLSAPAIAADAGSLQPAGCISAADGRNTADCTHTDGLVSADNVAISPDGNNVYVVSNDSWAISSFKRGGDGKLSPAGCIASEGGTESGDCSSADGLVSPAGVAVSPDGKNVYVAAANSNAVTIFNRGGDGSLTPAGCFASSGGVSTESCTTTDGLAGAVAVAVSPDGKNVYVAASNSSAVAVFARAASGVLTPAGCLASPGGDSSAACTSANALDGASSVVVSPDGNSVYATADESKAVVTFTRAGDGALTPAGCIASPGGVSSEQCDPADGLDGAGGVAASPDGKSIYVAAIESYAVSVFKRGAGGALTDAGCFASSGGSAAESCSSAPGLAEAEGVAVSADGNNVYVAASLSNAVAVFNRAGDGGLTSAGCVASSGGDASNSCSSANALVGADGVAVSPDGHNAYVTSIQSSSISTLDRSAGGATGSVVPSPSRLTFGKKTVGTKSKVKKITLQNSGSDPIHVDTVSIGGRNRKDFQLRNDQCSSQTVESGGSCTVGVRFAPKSEGKRRGTLKFIDDASNSPQKAKLSGRGL